VICLNHTALTFRLANREDAGTVLMFVKKLAEYEGLANEVKTDVISIQEHMFDRSEAEALFALEDGKEVGIAIFFKNFSTFLGKAGLYLEDLFVLPQYRGKGYGKALLKELARIAIERDCGRFEWVCLDWNQPSIDFYRSMGAVPQSDWTIYRLQGDEIKKASEK